MKTKIIAAVAVSVLVIIIGIALGSVFIPPEDIFSILLNRLFGVPLPEHITSSSVNIMWTLRLPRTLLAFIAGGALSVSGAVMQSVLRNPLASSYTLGVSSGASLGAGIVLLYGVTLPFASMFALPLTGFVFGVATIFIVIAFSSRIDGRMENNTIILTGMVLSLFINAITSLLTALSREQMQRLIVWQMGSFLARGWSSVLILAPLAVAGTIFILHFNRELDMMTFGEEQAQTMGVNMKKTKWIMLSSAAALTGGVVSFTGIIGFVDLVSPHIVRRVFGSSHIYVIPLSAIFGGTFMVICDLIARTVVSPSELPVGVVTALIGAPFFAYVYFAKGRRR